MSLRLFVVFFAFGSASFAQSGDPVHAGRKRSEWEAMLREQQNARLRKVAVVSLGQIVADNPTDPLLVKEVMRLIGVTLKTDAAPSVRAQAATVCNSLAPKFLEPAKANDPAAFDPMMVVFDLTENLRVEKETEVRREVAAALGRYGKMAKPAREALAAILADKDAGVRENAATTLGRIGPDAAAAAPELIKLVADTERAVKLAAVFALGRVEPEDTEKAAAALTPILQDRTDPAMRREAVVSLGFIRDGAPASVQALAAGLSDPDTGVRRGTAEALGKLVGAIKVVEAELKKAVSGDADKEVRGAALHALCDGFGEDAKDLLPFLLQRLAEDKEFDVKLALIDEIGNLHEGGRPALPALRGVQKDPQVKLREAAAVAIRRIEKPPAKPKAETPPEMPPKPVEPPKKPVPVPVPEEPEEPKPEKPV